jgi:hypothetical protein
MERMAPGAAAASIDPHGDTDAREQRPVRIDLVKLEAYRQTLDDLDPIAGRVLGGRTAKSDPVPGLMLTTCAVKVRPG